LQLPDRIFAAAARNRTVFRAFGDNILGFAPALCYTEDDFALLFARLETILNEVLDQPEVRRALA
jgi:4-aminobutyrate---pyruvate transaminase